MISIIFNLISYKIISVCKWLNIKLSNSQLNKSKLVVKNGTKVTLNFSSNVIDYSSVETNFPLKLLLTDRQFSRLRKAFANNLSANIKLSKTELSKIVQSGGFLVRLCGRLLEPGLSLIKKCT